MLTREQIAASRKLGLLDTYNFNTLCDQAEAAIELHYACQAVARAWDGNGALTRAIREMKTAMARCETILPAAADKTRKAKHVEPDLHDDWGDRQ